MSLRFSIRRCVSRTTGNYFLRESTFTLARAMAVVCSVSHASRSLVSMSFRCRCDPARVPSRALPLRNEKKLGRRSDCVAHLATVSETMPRIKDLGSVSAWSPYAPRPRKMSTFMRAVA